MKRTNKIKSTVNNLDTNGLSSKEWGNYKRTRQGALAVLLLYLYNLQVVHTTTMCLPALMSMHHPHVVVDLKP